MSVSVVVLTECEPPVVKQAGNGEKMKLLKSVENPACATGMSLTVYVDRCISYMLFCVRHFVFVVNVFKIFL